MRTSVRPEVFVLLQRNIKAKTGLEEAVVNQATVWPESGAARAAASRENPVLFLTPNQYNPHRIFQIGNGFGLYWFGAGNRTGFSRLVAARSAPFSSPTGA